MYEGAKGVICKLSGVFIKWSGYYEAYGLERQKDGKFRERQVERAKTSIRGSPPTNQDPVYTGYKWMREVLINQRAQVSYLKNGAKDNPIIEAFHSSLKRENKDLFLEAENICELKRIAKERVKYYNQERRHSTLLQVAPLTYLKREKILPEETKSLVEISA